MESIVLEKARPPDGPSWQARASCLGDVCVLSAQSSDADGGDLPHCPGPCGQLCLLSAPPVHFLREGMHGGRLRASCNPQGPRMGAPRLPYQVAKEASERGVREKGRSGETVGTLLRLFHPRTFLETWENTLGWFLPHLTPLKRGLHSILASLPVCLLICTTIPLLPRYVAGSPVWGGTHLLGLWTHAANR